MLTTLFATSKTTNGDKIETIKFGKKQQDFCRSRFQSASAEWIKEMRLFRLLFL